MADNPPPLPPRAPLAPKPPRPPVPGWMWLLFTLGPLVLGGFFGAVAGLGDGGSARDMMQGMGGGAVLGLICAPLFAGALALSSRFFTPPGARIVGTLMFVVLLVVGLGAVFFAGCMCLMQTGQIH